MVFPLERGCVDCITDPPPVPPFFSTKINLEFGAWNLGFIRKGGARGGSGQSYRLAMQKKMGLFDKHKK